MVEEKTFFVDPRASVIGQVAIAADEIFLKDVELRIHCPDSKYLERFETLLKVRLEQMNEMPRLQ